MSQVRLRHLLRIKERTMNTKGKEKFQEDFSFRMGDKVETG